MRALPLLLVAATAHAGPNEISLGGNTRALRAPSADALTSDSLGGGQLSYARALDLELPYRLALWIDAGFEWGSAHGTMFQTMTTEIESFAPVAGARVTYVPHRRVAVAGRLAVGAPHESLTLTGASGLDARDHAWGALATASLAVDLRVIANPNIDLAVRLQLGYVEASRVGLTPHRDGPGDGTLTLPVMDQSIGHLDLSGPTAGISAVAAF